LSVLFTRLNAQCSIPENLTDLIVANFSDPSDESSSSEESNKEESPPQPDLSVLEDNLNSDTTISEMPAMTPAEFINTAAKLIPDFDGKFENLQRFLDALTLLDSIKGDHESIAITLIKTKLIGTARNLISSETSINLIKSTLISKVKGQSTQAVTAKLLNTRQNNKSPNDFAKEIEETTKLLQNAYISEGLTPELAETYSTQAAVKAVIKNSNSDNIKIIMQAGQFSSLNQVITKFIESSSNVNENPRVNYMQKNQHGSYHSNYRGRGNGNRGNRGRRNFYRGNNQNQSNNYQNNQNRSSNRGRSNNRNVRQINASSENEAAPQTAHLGNVQNM